MMESVKTRYRLLLLFVLLLNAVVNLTQSHIFITLYSFSSRLSSENTVVKCEDVYSVCVLCYFRFEVMCVYLLCEKESLRCKCST